VVGVKEMKEDVWVRGGQEVQLDKPHLIFQ